MMLVKIEKNVNSSYRNVMQKLIYLETDHIECLVFPGTVKMVSGNTHSVSKEDFGFLFDILKNSSVSKAQVK